MSSSDQNIEKQTKRHKGPLLGIAFGLAVVALMFFAYIVWSADEVGREGSDQEQAITPISE